MELSSFYFLVVQLYLILVRLFIYLSLFHAENWPGGEMRLRRFLKTRGEIRTNEKLYFRLLQVVESLDLSPATPRKRRCAGAVKRNNENVREMRKVQRALECPISCA